MPSGGGGSSRLSCGKKLSAVSLAAVSAELVADVSNGRLPPFTGRRGTGKNLLERRCDNVGLVKVSIGRWRIRLKR